MKYTEAHAAAIEGKFIRVVYTHVWSTMKEDGEWIGENGLIVRNPTLFEIKKDTWEIKPQEIFVWGIKNSVTGNDYLYRKHPEDSMQLSDQMPMGNANFPKDKPQKYKLVPVNDDE